MTFLDVFFLYNNFVLNYSSIKKILYKRNNSE